MPDAEEPRARRQLSIDLSDLELAFETAPGEMSYYLNLETGEVVLVTDEAQEELNALHEELLAAGDELLAGFTEALAERDLPEWMHEAVAQENDVDAGFGTRYIAVPHAESVDGYQDMEEFISTVQDARLQYRLEAAIRGRGALRRFKDVLLDLPRERDAWFAFQASRVRQRVLEWLEDDGIEPQSRGRGQRHGG